MGEYKDGTQGDLYYISTEFTRDDTFIAKLTETFNKVEGVKYDVNVFDWVKAEFGWSYGNCQRMDRFWCSALMAYLYVQFGFLSSDTPWTIVPPKSFSYYENSQLHFTDCKLEPEKKIIF